MSLDIQNSSDLIEQINSLKNDSNGMLTIWQIVVETWEFVKNFKVRFDEDLQELASNVSKNIWDFEEYKKSAIQYILLAEKLIYPERDQWINDIIYKTWDNVYKAFLEHREPFERCNQK